MIIEKIKSTNSIPEMVTLFITINFIIQTSYKFGYFSNYGYWMISLFSPIELMFGNLELILMYIMIFTGILYEKAFITTLGLILSITICPHISNWIYTGNFYIPPLSIFGLTIGFAGYLLKKVKENTSIEVFLFFFLLCIAPLIYGLNSSGNLQDKKLAHIELKDQNSGDFYILEKFSDSFLLVNKKDNTLKIVKIEDATKIQIIK